MSSLLIAAIAVAALGLGYVIYGRLVRKWLGLDPDMTPPSVALYDSVDYVPAKHWTVLFGHHFASIAGAGPIMGPVIACLFWGWAPALLWVVVGGIFLGGVHDYFALAASVENRGRSVNDLSESVLGKGARTVFGMFVLLALILVVAVFAAAAADTLVDKPEIVIPTFGLILVAMLVGFLIYRTKFPLALSTLLGVAMLFGLLVLGTYVPVRLPVAAPARWWTVILLIYSVAASVLPVWFLLQPRDHISYGILFLGMLFGLLGIVIVHPTVKAPAFVAYRAPEGPLWPMLFVMVACGAISGFHSLVSSGTTSKQLPRIRDAGRIGYGAMITESALAVIAIISVAAGLYWSREQIPAGVEGTVYGEVFRQGWIKAFGVGYGELTKAFFGRQLAPMVGIILLNAFIVTTLDTAARITRYICCELVGDTFRVSVFRNRYVATITVTLAAAALALGNWKAIWPIFGSANQLIAALVLIVGTAYLLTRNRPWLFTAIPADFVLITTIGALVLKAIGFLKGSPGTGPNYVLGVIAVVLICLGLFVAYRGAVCIVHARRQQVTAAGGA